MSKKNFIPIFTTQETTNKNNTSIINANQENQIIEENIQQNLKKKSVSLNNQHEFILKTSNEQIPYLKSSENENFLNHFYIKNYFQLIPAISNQYTPITHQQMQCQFQELEESSDQQNKQKNSQKQLIQIKKRGAFSSSQKKKFKKKPFQQIPQKIELLVRLKLIFKESNKEYIIGNYNICSNTTSYQLKYQILQYLQSQSLLRSNNLGLYIQQSQVIFNNQYIEHWQNIELSNYENNQIIIEIFQTKSTIFNLKYDYDPQLQRNEISHVVLGFKIVYKEISVQWQGLVDISYVNLNEIINLENDFQLYNINEIGYFRVPEQGQKLNVAKIIEKKIPEELLVLSMNNCGNPDYEYLKAKLKNQCQLLGQEFLYIQGLNYCYFQQ